MPSAPKRVTTRFAMGQRSTELAPSVPAPDAAGSLTERQIDTHGRTLREHTARGTLINSGFQVGLAGVRLLQRLLVAAFLTQAEFGLWGILIATLLTLSWLKELGIADKYVQQAEPDQEAAFQKAFSLELALSLAFFAFVAAAFPLYALAYGHEEMIVPGIVLALSVPLTAFEAPAWIPYRRLQYVRHRVLLSVNPLVSFAVTISLGIAGAGYWALVAGVLAGALGGGIAATVSSPYRLALRFDRSTAREYAGFSWPLVGFGLSNLLVVQGTLLVANHTVGLAGIGVIGLAGLIASFGDRVDGIISQTIYPAVCATADRIELLHETFVKSNRVTLIWAMPFGVGLALFASDLITYVLGEQWRDAEPLLIAIGLIVAIGQVGFNWTIFMRAVNDTKPIFLASLLGVGSFFCVMVPALLAFGLAGYAVGLAAATALQLIAREHFLRRLFPGFAMVRQLLRAIAPSVPAAGLILAIRLLLGDQGSLPLALAELTLYAAATVSFTYLFERRLVGELIGYLRRRPRPDAIGRRGLDRLPSEQATRA